MKAQEIANALGGEVTGDPELEIERAVQPDLADGKGDMAVAISPDFFQGLATTRAAAAILPAGVTGIEIAPHTVIRVPADRKTLPTLSALFRNRPNTATGVHSTAVIGQNVTLGDNVSIGPLCYVADNAIIGDGTTLVSHVTVGENSELGGDSIVYSGARIGIGVKIGSRAVIHPNAAIGADGFSFHPVDPGNVEAVKATGKVSDKADRNSSLLKNESLGGVIIGNDVEIGASTCIDSGTLKPTSIGDGTKIDDLVMIGHNVRIGEHCVLCAQAGIAGSTVIGDRVTLGGRAGIGDNLKIGDDAIIGAAAGVGTSVPAGGVYYGMPAVPRERAHRDVINIRKLDRVIKKVEGK
ncbi:UDP-3-O-(3-hydroxymyristoyl)glucosamine N-acyltransferase [Hoeflea prorocentri]|uniref:UDP-3-O-(3-hydroxymyristoyl)glucosamine N-acyltransferase n=1 Tax=Hoeflea prorocentri TaxID=1922333 RepID=A0A9X3UGQ7_9HYPH|nr:UDP-3-O-(3-hydroxymyristoyl)glucosamine N-acyltransferase [Hoeflea prorocentri]MCY6380319.1 UDP-3-O-(3-hydroxymyristoyl)glucosamine N-acyltransferase [Hoeflea prorocentri]MDA5398119.1 UDP-3-O-(3-hydroxymyristoyl)glucosamine N-acyltransferase [Hoeflea prorocentri]